MLVEFDQIHNTIHKTIQIKTNNKIETNTKQPEEILVIMLTS